MKKVEAPLSDCGVVIGRFQVAKLHEAHKDLIKSVCDLHSKVIVFLGISYIRGTVVNPLDFEARKQMILEDFPNVIIHSIKDQETDEEWSAVLDDRIGEMIGPRQTVTLYGSRDSFIEKYYGKFATQELISENRISGTEIRNKISQSVDNSEAWRCGATWQTYNQFPTCFPTVDVAILNEDGTQVLLGRKRVQKEFRFVGGFADPKSVSYEADARRETAEETTVEISDPEYVGSMIVDDVRYRDEEHKIKTLLFKAKYIYGCPTPSDDLKGGEVKWFDIKTLNPVILRPEHRKLFEMLKKNLNV